MIATAERASGSWTMIDEILPPAPAPAPQTLDAALGAMFTSLQQRRSAVCLVCGGTMLPRESAVGISGGRCGDCLSTLG